MIPFHNKVYVTIYFWEHRIDFLPVRPWNHAAKECKPLIISVGR